MTSIDDFELIEHPEDSYCLDSTEKPDEMCRSPGLRGEIVRARVPLASCNGHFAEITVTSYRVHVLFRSKAAISVRLADIGHVDGSSRASTWLSNASNASPQLLLSLRDGRKWAVAFVLRSTQEAMTALLRALCFPSPRVGLQLAMRGGSAERADDDLHAFLTDLAWQGILDVVCPCVRKHSVMAQAERRAVVRAQPPSVDAEVDRSGEADIGESVSVSASVSRFVQGMFGMGAEAPASPSLPMEDQATRNPDVLCEARTLFPVCEKCSGWRVSRVNQNGRVCATYPDLLVVPAALCDDDIVVAAQHRSARRFPVLAYRHRASGGVLMRSSQPCTGLTGHRSRADELLLAAARRTCFGADGADEGLPLLIADARPTANAMANMALGGGYESPVHYAHSSVIFLGVANIHAVRADLARIAALFDVDAMNMGDVFRANYVNVEGDHADMSPDMPGEPEDDLMVGKAGNGSNALACSTAAAPWLEEMRRLLEGALVVARHMEAGGVVLLHCSDGWDRTPQICMLTRLLLDSSCRTARGFCDLIRGQWLAMGHKSAERQGLGEVMGGREQSPCLVQWMECVWNVWQQHPSAFEFTPMLMAIILHYAHDFRFGSFFGNSVRERKALGVTDAACLWRYLLSGAAEREHGSWRNPLYDPSETDAMLTLAVGGSDVRVWWAYHRRGFEPLAMDPTFLAALRRSPTAATPWPAEPILYSPEDAGLKRMRQLLRSRDDFSV